MKRFFLFIDWVTDLKVPLHFGVKNYAKNIDFVCTNSIEVIYFQLKMGRVIPMQQTNLSLSIIHLEAKLSEPFCDHLKGQLHVFNQKVKIVIPSHNIEQITNYKHAILLNKLYNQHFPLTYLVELNFDQILTSRQTYFKISKSKNYKAGNNKLATRLTIIKYKVILMVQYKKSFQAQ